MGAGVSAQEAEPPSPTQSPSGEASDQERQHTAAADRRPVQKNSQISGIHGNSEDQEVLSGKLEQLNGLQEEAIPGKVEPPSLSQEEELKGMELDQKETPTETKDEEPKDSHEAADTPAEIGEEAQAEEVGFKKVFKFVGCKITVKKEKPVKLEPVQLLTVRKGEDGEVNGESKQEEEGTKNGEVSPVAEAEGSPPEILSPLKTESSGEVELKLAVAEETLMLVESAASPAESPAVDSPLKRFFRQGFFSVLRRKPSFKKAKDELLVTEEKTEENGEQKENEDQVTAAGDIKGKEGDHGAKSQKEAPASEETAEILDVQAVEEKDDDFEDLTAELADVRKAKEGLSIDGGKDGVSAEQDQLQEPELVLAAAALEKDLVSQLTTKTDQSASAEGEINEEFVSLGASEGLSAEQTDVAQEQSSVKASEPIMGEAELLSSQEKAKLQGSPLKKLFTSSSIKKLSSKRTKGKKGESKPGDAGDDARLQSSTESEGSPEGQKPESPLTSPEEMGGVIPAETADAPDSVSPEAEGVNGSANGEAKKESITAWASFKKLVTSKKRPSPKIPSENDKEEEQTDKAKSATISSNESAASVEKEEAPKSITEEQSLEPSTDDPRKKADAPVSWEALICVGSSKKRARKLSDSEAPKPNEEAQRLIEESSQVQEDAEEVKVSGPPDTDQEHGGTSPDGAANPVEEVSGAISTWESFKRLVTSRRKSKSKLEERTDEPVAAAETIAPETEPAKEESWASFKKLIPGRRKKRSDTKPEPLAEGDEGDARWAELRVNKSDEESDTPAVVPLSEYDAMEEEQVAKEQQIIIATEEPLTKPEDPAGTREPSAEQTITMERGPLEVVKSSIDERSPSWISAAVSNVVEKTIEEKIVEEMVAVNEHLKEEVQLGGATPLAEVTKEIDAVEVAEEAQEVTSEVVMALEYPAEESLTEETTEMVSAVSQLTETPATTAEGTPIREDEALVTRQTQEVLQEAAERVKLSAVGPAVSSGETLATSEAQEPEIALEKMQAEVVEASCEIEILNSVQEAKVSDAASEGTASVESESVQHGLSEMVQQTAVEMQEALAPQSFESEPEPIPPIELKTTAEVVADVAQTSEYGISQEDKAKGPEGALQQSTEEIPVQEIATALRVEVGMSETVIEKVEAEKVQSLCAETLESSGAADVVKPGAPSEESIEVTGMSCLGEVLPEGEETVIAAPAETAETLRAEKVAAPREALEAIPATIEAILEQTDGAIQEVATEVKVGKVEVILEENIGNAQEIGGEVKAEETVEMGREILVSGVNVEMVCEQSTEIIPESVTQAVHSDEAMAITPTVTLTEVFSEEMANLHPAVEVTEAALGKETVVVSPVVTVAEVVGEEAANLIPAVEVSKAALGDEENVQIIPVVGVTEALHSEETIKNTPVMQVMEIACMEKAIKTSPIVVTEVVCSVDATKIIPVVAVEAVESEGTVKIGPVVEVKEAVCTKDTSVMAEAGPPGESTEISSVAKVVDVGPIVEETEAVPIVEETEAVHGPELTVVVPVVKETEAVHGPEGIEVSPVEEMKAVQVGTAVSPVVEEMEAAQEGTEVSPVVEETEAVCAPKSTEVSLVVEEMDAVCSQEDTEISRVVEETEVVHGPEGTEVSPVMEETEAAQEGTEVSPVEMEAACGPEGTKVSRVVEEMDTTHSQEDTEISAILEVTEVVHGPEGTEVSLVVKETEVVPSPEGTEVSPVVDETETIHGQEAIDTSPTLEKIECVDSRETIAADLVKVGMREDEAVYEGKDDLAIAQQGIEKGAQMMAIDNDKITQEQFGTVKIIQEIVTTKVCGEAAENIETKVSETVCKEIKTLEEMEDKQRTKEQVVEILIPATEMIQPEPGTVKLSKETIQTSVTEVVKCVETEIDAVCNKRLHVALSEGTKEEPQIELQEASVVEVMCIATDVSQHIMKEEIGPTELPKDEFEILLGAPVEKKVTEAPIVEEVESETKESHLSVSCVTSEPQSTVTEELTARHEIECVKQVVELVGEVECELSTVEKDKPAPHEAESMETSCTDGEPVLGDKLDGANKDGQGDVAGSKECDTEEAAESQKDAMEDLCGVTDERVIEMDTPGELASTHTSTESGKEEPELDEDLALGSDHKVKLHSDSDELHAVQSETMTPIVGSSVALSSESLEVLIPVTEVAVEEQIVTETAASEVTELSELSTGYQVSQSAEPDIALGPVAETAAAIVEAAIEVAAGTVVDSPSVSQEMCSTLDGQKLQSSPMELLEGALVERPSESLEMETEVKVGEMRTFEQESTMLAQSQTQDDVMPTEVQVDAVSAGQGKDSVQLHKEDEEKVAELQTVTAAEGKSDEVIGQSMQTQEVEDTEALEQEMAVTHSTKVVSEAVGEGDQKPVETEIDASVEAGQEMELLPAPISEGAAIMPDVSKITKVECCQSVDKPEGMSLSPELTETKEQPAESQLQPEETSLQHVPAAMTLPIEESRMQGAVDKLEGAAVESIEHKDVKEMDQNKMAEAVEKQGGQEMPIEHQMDQSSTLECTQSAVEKTPS